MVGTVIYWTAAAHNLTLTEEHHKHPASRTAASSYLFLLMKYSQSLTCDTTWTLLDSVFKTFEAEYRGAYL